MLWRHFPGRQDIWPFSCVNQAAKPNAGQDWEQQFVESVCGHVMNAGTLSTEQAKIVIRIARKHVTVLAEDLRVDTQRIVAALDNPTFKRPPYPSTNVPREARFVGGSTIALRFKRNETVSLALGQILGLDRPGRKAAVWNREFRVWLCTVDALSAGDLVELFLAFNFDVDAGTIALCERALVETGGPSLHVDADGLVLATPPRAALLRWWAAPHAAPAEDGTLRLPLSPALARRALALTALTELEVSPEVRALAEEGRLGDDALAHLPGSYRAHDLAAIQDMLDRDCRCVIPTNGLGKVRHNALAAALLSGAPSITVCASDGASWCAIARMLGHEDDPGDAHAFLRVLDVDDPHTDELLIARRDGLLITDVQRKATPLQPYALSATYLAAAREFRHAILLCRTASSVRLLLGSPLGYACSGRIVDYVRAIHGEIPPILRPEAELQGVVNLILDYQGLTAHGAMALAPLFDLLTNYVEA